MTKSYDRWQTKAFKKQEIKIKKAKKMIQKLQVIIEDAEYKIRELEKMA